MSPLSQRNAIPIEKFLEMETGYVCDFSDRSFRNFVLAAAGIDVYTEAYDQGGTSKAKRLRTFWRTEPDHVVAKVTRELVEYWRERKAVSAAGLPFDQALYEQCLKAIERVGATVPQASESSASQKQPDSPSESLPGNAPGSARESAQPDQHERESGVTVRAHRGERAEPHWLTKAVLPSIIVAIVATLLTVFVVNDRQDKLAAQRDSAAKAYDERKRLGEPTVTAIDSCTAAAIDLGILNAKRTVSDDTSFAPRYSRNCAILRNQNLIVQLSGVVDTSTVRRFIAWDSTAQRFAIIGLPLFHLSEQQWMDSISRWSDRMHGLQDTLRRKLLTYR